MRYLITYLGAGAAILLIVLGQHIHHEYLSRAARLARAVEAQFGEQRTLKDRVLGDLVVPLLAAIMVLIAWPAILVWLLWRWLVQRKGSALTAEPREFAVAREDLQEALSIPEVEQRARVVDPLGAVPDLPFGHLHAVWHKFCEELKPGDVLWSFNTPSRDWQGPKSGYVIVRRGATGRYFLTPRATGQP